MNSPAQILADFRSQVTQLLQERDTEWEASRKLVEARQLATTLKRLIEEAHRIDLPLIIRERSPWHWEMQKLHEFRISQAPDSRN
ncbi:MAG: hypothetical protein E8D47_09855 [Nitrospira sp.]|nr:MAG: hypothetical protein E8D47_09855 [Nitrospira sp.]